MAVAPFGSWSLPSRHATRRALVAARATSTRLDHTASSFLPPPLFSERPGRPPPATRARSVSVTFAAGVTNRPSWTEAAAGMGRGRSKGEARVPKPPKPVKLAQIADPDEAGRASRKAAATASGSLDPDSVRNPKAASPASRGDRRGNGSSARRGGVGAGGPRGSGRSRAVSSDEYGTGMQTRGGGGEGSGRFIAETGGASARAAAAAAPRSSARVTARNVQALREAFSRGLRDRADAASGSAVDIDVGDAEDSEEDREPSFSSSSSSLRSVNRPTYSGAGFRLVRCMPHLRRREADAAVSSGRVRVNGALVKPSRRCVGGDVVTLDGAVMDWEGFADACEAELDSEPGSELDGFVYLKYHKPRGVTCTMEPSQKSSVLYALKDELEALRALRRGGGGGGGGGGGSPPRRSRPGSGSIRVFPVGRLDRDSSGLVLLTDDGRVPEALLDPDRKAPKVYDVDIDREVSDEQIRRLRAGVVITTTQQRGGASSTAATAPCEVRRIAPNETAFSRAALRFTLREGRNRQIRKMCEAVGVEVTRLHRVSTADVTLFLGEGESLLETGGLRRVEGDELRSLASAVSESLAKKRREGSDSGKPRVEAKEGWGTRIRDEASGRHG